MSAAKQDLTAESSNFFIAVETDLASACDTIDTYIDKEQFSWYNIKKTCTHSFPPIYRHYLRLVCVVR